LKLLSVRADAKTVKGEKYDFLTGILYLAPAENSGVINACPYASPGCKASCLFTAGNADTFPSVNESRIRKTQWYVKDPTGFCLQLTKDIEATVRKAKREGLKPCFRLNGTSDIPKLARIQAMTFPNLQFYDYTKIPKPWLRILPNYHLTFSLSETNEQEAREALKNGINTAVVFNVKPGDPLPKTWSGYPVLDGDLHDLRFKRGPKVVIVGLRAKGRARKDTSGFVQIVKGAL
jgi:hypothetical protein